MKKIITQKTINVKVTPSKRYLTSRAGLFLISLFIQKLGIDSLIDKTLTVKKRNRGFSHSQFLLSLVYLFLAGGEFLDDLRTLRHDSAFQEITGITIPTPSALFKFLKKFFRGHINQLFKVNKILFHRVFLLINLPRKITLDIDSSIHRVYGYTKEGASWTFKKCLGLHPLFAFIAEIRTLLHFRLRRGSTYAGKGIAGFLRECANFLPSWCGVRMRADTAAYDFKVVKECEVLGWDFTITAPKFDSLIRQAREISKDRWVKAGEEEYAEFYYCPREWFKPYRFIVTRVMRARGEQLDLWEGRYIYHFMVTSMRGAVSSLVRFHRKRGDSAEGQIKELKYGIGMGHLPLGKFMSTYVWMWAGQMAYNIASWFKLLVLPGDFQNRRIKGIRFWFLLIAGLLKRRSRERIMEIQFYGDKHYRDFKRTFQNLQSL